MKNRPLIAYLTILTLLCAGFFIGMKALGQQEAMLVQFYMLTPALAALVSRLFFYEHKFKDAKLRLGRLSDYSKFWLIALGITALSYLIFTLLGSVTWDLSGSVFLERLTQQFAMAGQEINDTLPPGFTPQVMLGIFFIGGLTVFNILPGIITGFGEEFGHRGFMFPLLYNIRPWVGFIIGGLIWYIWHLPLAIVAPQTAEYSSGQMVINASILAIGTICSFIFLAYVYVKSESVFVTAITHIVMNNSAVSFSYFVVVEDQVLANLGLTLTMVIVVAVLYFKKELDVFRTYFSRSLT